MITRDRLRPTVRRLATLTLSAGLVATACAPEEPGPTTTTTTTAPSTVRTLTDATFEWTVSRETDHGTFAPGEVNYWSAGQSDSTEATYKATDGNATVLKRNASGTYVPIASEPSVSWANRTRSGDGTPVTATSANYLGQKVRFTGGTGTLDRATGASTIQWTGSFSINFYGRYVPFWITNPKLVVDASGHGTITASVAGFASSLDNPDVRTPLPSTQVVIADLPSVAGNNDTGFTAATGYLGNVVTPPAPAGPQVAKTAANSAWWGAWPQSFVDFQAATGLGAYWYTSGGFTDIKKPQEPVTVAYNLGAS
ncbi:MAG: hypothetical protein R2698_07995 [Microthrixaceae bacterium]